MCCFGNSSQTEAILLALDLLTCSGFSLIPRPVISSVVIVDGRPDDTDNIKHSPMHPTLLLGSVLYWTLLVVFIQCKCWIDLLTLLGATNCGPCTLKLLKACYVAKN